MRTIVKEEIIYSLDDVKNNPELLKKVLEKHQHINVEYNDWWDGSYEKHKEETKFNVDRRYFSGFWSQGDGAMFEYSGFNNELKDMFIDSLDLSPMRKEWLRNNVSVYGKGKQSGHYYHENSCSHNIYWEVDNGDIPQGSGLYMWIESFYYDFEEFIIKAYKEECGVLYSDLNKEYDYFVSEEAILETLECSEYEFDEQGNII